MSLGVTQSDSSRFERLVPILTDLQKLGSGEKIHTSRETVINNLFQQIQELAPPSDSFSLSNAVKDITHEVHDYVEKNGSQFTSEQVEYISYGLQSLISKQSPQNADETRVWHQAADNLRAAQHILEQKEQKIADKRFFNLAGVGRRLVDASKKVKRKASEISLVSIKNLVLTNPLHHLKKTGKAFIYKAQTELSEQLTTVPNRLARVFASKSTPSIIPLTLEELQTNLKARLDSHVDRSQKAQKSFTSLLEDSSLAQTMAAKHPDRILFQSSPAARYASHQFYRDLTNGKIQFNNQSLSVSNQILDQDAKLDEIANQLYNDFTNETSGIMNFTQQQEAFTYITRIMNQAAAAYHTDHLEGILQQIGDIGTVSLGSSYQLNVTPTEIEIIYNQPTRLLLRDIENYPSGVPDNGTIGYCTVGHTIKIPLSNLQRETSMADVFQKMDVTCFYTSPQSSLET